AGQGADGDPRRAQDEAGDGHFQPAHRAPPRRTPGGRHAGRGARQRCGPKGLSGEGRPLMLAVENLNAWYDHSHILQGVSLDVRTGEIVSIIGRNGAGKTTTLRTIMGLVKKCSGGVAFGEEPNLLSRPAHSRYRLGLGYVPE